MAGNSAVLTVKILTDASGAQKGINSAASRMDKFQAGVKKMTPYALAAAGGLVLLGKKAVGSASELEQAQGAVESVYGKSAKAVENYAKTSADRLGVAKSEYLNSAALMGSALQNAGFSASKAASQTDKAFTRSADLAATFGGTAADAMDAINAAVSRGEFDPLEKYAISLNQTAVNAELAKRGQDDLTGAALKNAKAQATLDLIYQQSNQTAGQFAKESDTAAGQQQRAAAAFEDASAALGKSLLPAVTEITKKLAGLATWMSQNSRLVLTFAAVLGGLAAAVLAVNAAFAIYTATTRVITAVTKGFAIATRLLNAALRMNPIGIVVTALLALGAGLVLAYKKSATFRNIVNAAFSAVKKVVVGVLNFFTGKLIPFFTRTLPNAFRAGWNKVKSVTVNVVNAIVTFVRKLPGRIASAITSLPGKLKNLFTRAWQGAKQITARIASAIVGYVRSLPGKFINGLSALGSKLRNLFTRAFSTAKTAVVNAGTAIVGAVKAIPGKLGNLASAFGSAGRSIINAFVNGLKNAGGVISGIAGNVWNAVKSLLNSAIDKINSALEFTINIPGPNIHINPPNIPHLARGGIITSPTLAVLGDNRSGREAVVPLERAGEYGFGGGDVHIYINGTLHDADAARAVRRVLRNDNRRRGGVVINRTRQALVT